MLAPFDPCTGRRIHVIIAALVKAPLITFGVISILAALIPACKSEVDHCREQLDLVLTDFYADTPDALRVAHFASFDRLVQHNAPACLSKVLHNAGIDETKAARFELIAPLWRGASADRNSSLEPEVDHEGILRASPSADFYRRACDKGFEAACARATLAQEVLDCSRAKASACERAAKLLATDKVDYRQAFASPLTLRAQACASGSTSSCKILASAGKAAAELCKSFKIEAQCSADAQTPGAKPPHDEDPLER